MANINVLAHFCSHRALQPYRVTSTTVDLVCWGSCSLTHNWKPKVRCRHKLFTHPTPLIWATVTQMSRRMQIKPHTKSVTMEVLVWKTRIWIHIINYTWADDLCSGSEKGNSAALWLVIFFESWVVAVRSSQVQGESNTSALCWPLRTNLNPPAVFLCLQCVTYLLGKLTSVFDISSSALCLVVEMHFFSPLSAALNKLLDVKLLIFW